MKKEQALQVLEEAKVIALQNVASRSNDDIQFEIKTDFLEKSEYNVEHSSTVKIEDKYATIRVQCYNIGAVFVSVLCSSKKESNLVAKEIQRYFEDKVIDKVL